MLSYSYHLRTVDEVIHIFDHQHCDEEDWGESVE
jgi:hypothetical protein